jgi:hypothetical protein
MATCAGAGASERRPAARVQEIDRTMMGHPLIPKKHACATHLALLWRPDEALFDLRRDNRLINAFVADAV